MKIQGLSAVWGYKYIDRFKNGMVKSLAFPKNKKAMEGVIWNIFTEDEHFDELEELLETTLPGTQIRLKPLSLIRDRIDYLHSALLWQMRECLKTDSRMLLIPVDSLFGDGTIENLKKIGKAPKSCVVVPHPRVLSSILTEPFQSNQSLVKAAWKHLHRSWLDAERDSERQNTFVSGVVWEKCEENLIMLKHLLPTPYLCDFTPQDIEFFEGSPGFGDIDWVWPGRLVQEGRQRYCTSSDACFIVEISDDDNHAPVIANQPKDGFFKNFPHNIVNNQTTAFFRGE